MKTKTNTKRPTQTALADALGISRQALSSHCKKSDAPKLSDLTGWQIYLAAHGRAGSAPPEIRAAIANERLAILKETRIKLERENAVDAKELMLVASAVRQAGEAMGLTFDELMRRDRELPPALAGLSAVDIFKRMSADTESIRKTLQAKFQEIGE